MPSLRFDWHERVKTVENEYRAVRLSVDRLKAALAADGGALGAAAPRKSLKDADGNLEGTYLIRLFASFESALRSYDRARHNDPDRETKASVLIDEIGGRRGQGIPSHVRRDAHDVRRARNHWAHDQDATPESMTVAEARARLQAYLPVLAGRSVGMIESGKRRHILGRDDAPDATALMEWMGKTGFIGEILFA